MAKRERMLTMARNEIHLVPNEAGGWDVKRAGNPAVIIHMETKEKAETAGRELSRKENAEFVVHGINGRIQRKDSHGHDPSDKKG